MPMQIWWVPFWGALPLMCVTRKSPHLPSSPPCPCWKHGQLQRYMAIFFWLCIEESLGVNMFIVPYLLKFPILSPTQTSPFCLHPSFLVFFWTSSELLEAFSLSVHCGFSLSKSYFSPFPIGVMSLIFFYDFLVISFHSCGRTIAYNF